MRAQYRYTFVPLAAILALFVAFLMPHSAESHDIGRRTKILVGLPSTASYAGDWYCWYPSPDPNGGFHPETGSCSGSQAYTSLDWDVPAETDVILNVWSSDSWVLINTNTIIPGRRELHGNRCDCLGPEHLADNRRGSLRACVASFIRLGSGR